MNLKHTIHIIIAFMLFFISTSTAFAVMPVGQTAGASKASSQNLQKSKKQNHKPDELLIKVKRGINAQSTHSILQSKGLKIAKAKQFKALKKTKKNLKHSSAGLDRWWHVKLKGGTDLKEAMAQLSTDPAVEHVELNYVVHALTTPNDPHFDELWGMNNISQTGGLFDADIDAIEAWESSTGDPNIIVAVIDTGVDYGHEDLADNMWVNPGEIAGNGIDDDNNGHVDDVYGYDFINDDADPFDDNGHGTHCSGTIAGKGNNAIGVTGVSWNAKIMALKFLSAGGSGSSSDAIDSIIYATNNGAKIMSNSWGGGGFSQAMLDAITAANDAGVLFVAAAGNSNSNNDSGSHYPSNYEVPNVISVAATDHNDNKASFSSYGPQTVHLGAPGASILSSVPTGGCELCASSGYLHLSGTSMATPHVSGAAALVLSKSPTLPVASVKMVLMDSGDQIASMADTTISGRRLNVANALNFNLDFSVVISPYRKGVLPGNSADYTVTVNSHGDTTQPITLSIDSIAPTLTAELLDETLTPPVGGSVSTTLTITTDVTTPRGDHVATIKATDESDKIVNISNVTVQALYPDFEVDVTPSLRVVLPGASTSYTVDVSSIDEYSSTVNLSVISPDPNITLSINPSMVTVEPNGTASATVTASTSSATPFQTYTFTIAGDDGQDNRSTTAQIKVQDIDLVMTDVSSPDTAVIIGESLTVNSTVTNQGESASGNFTVGYYLSTDSQITTGDTRIALRTVQGLGQGASINLSEAVTVPTWVSTGTYYIGVIADYYNSQLETDESNNSMGSATPVVIARDVDIAMASLSTPVSQGYTNSPIQVDFSFTNQGSAYISNYFRVGLYISTDPEITASDRFFASYHVSYMAPGSTLTIAGAPTLPHDLAEGTYYIGAIADYTNRHVETDETNNILGSATPVQVSKDVDFIMTVINTQTTQVNSGNSISVDFTLRNQGSSGVDTSDFGYDSFDNYPHVGIYLSTDPEITTADTFLKKYMTSSIGGNSDLERTGISVYIPAGLAGGTYYLGAIADYTDKQPETDETNNSLALATPIQVITPMADMVATAISTTSTQAYPGEYISVNYSFGNQGDATASSYVGVGVYLSTDATITTDDTMLTSTTYYSIYAGSSYDHVRNVRIPYGLASGAYYLGVITDTNENVDESDESNNSLAIAVPINVTN